MHIYAHDLYFIVVISDPTDNKFTFIILTFFFDTLDNRQTIEVTNFNGCVEVTCFETTTKHMKATIVRIRLGKVSE